MPKQSPTLSEGIRQNPVQLTCWAAEQSLAGRDRRRETWVIIEETLTSKAWARNERCRSSRKTIKQLLLMLKICQQCKRKHAYNERDGRYEKIHLELPRTKKCSILKTVAKVGRLYFYIFIALVLKTLILIKPSNCLKLVSKNYILPRYNLWPFIKLFSFSNSLAQQTHRLLATLSQPEEPGLTNTTMSVI